MRIKDCDSRTGRTLKSKMIPVNVKAVASANSLERAYRPLFLWIQLLTGIGLNRCSNRKKGFNLFLFIFSIAMLVFKICHTVYYIFEFVGGLHQDTMMNRSLIDVSSSTRTNVISETIGAFDTVYYLQAIHFVFFFVSLNRLKHLWQTMVDIEHRLGLTVHVYRKIKWTVFFGLLLIILNCSAYVCFSLSAWSMLHSRGLDAVCKFLLFVESATTTSILILLWVLINSNSYFFQVLNQQIKDLAKRSYAIRLEELKIWKSNFACVCRMVHWINHCFGLIVLIAVSHGFLTFIANSYQFLARMTGLKDDQHFSGLSFLFLVIQEFTFLSILICTSYNLTSEGHRIRSSLYQFDAPNPQIQNLLNGMMTQVSEAHISVSAWDFFDVNLSLFPALIGTTLTYVIILLQSSSS